MAPSLEELYDRLIELQKSKNRLVFALAEDELSEKYLSPYQRASARETISIIESEIIEIQEKIREHMGQYGDH